MVLRDGEGSRHLSTIETATKSENTVRGSSRAREYLKDEWSIGEWLILKPPEVQRRNCCNVPITSAAHAAPFQSGIVYAPRLAKSSWTSAVTKIADMFIHSDVVKKQETF